MSIGLVEQMESTADDDQPSDYWRRVVPPGTRVPSRLTISIPVWYLVAKIGIWDTKSLVVAALPDPEPAPTIVNSNLAKISLFN